MSSGRIDGKLARVATKNDGVFDRRQAHECGFSDEQIRYRLSTGVWGEILPGVYRNTATPETVEGMRRAALLWAGDGAALSHHSAGVLCGIEGIVETKPELVVPMRRHPRSRLVIVHRSDALIPHDFTRRAGLRCTTASRTIIDLAGAIDAEALEVAIESARRMRLVTVESIRKRLDPIAGRGRAGATDLRRLLEMLDGHSPSESRLEVKVARLLRLSPLPAPVRQHRVRSQGRRYRLDFAWPELRLALECDSRAFHEFQRDRTRWRHLGASGWRVLPVTWSDVTTSWPTVLAEVTAAFGVPV